ncbi:MAG TPA: DNA alkylation repair protein, partial [Planctomycetota bacterium]|nr:DNA alkylation repair protein [Planctomycetota bacterium]
MASPRTSAKTPAKKPAPKPSAARMSLAETMRALEKAGTAQARKTYARHGAQEPMFGVSFATLKELVKRIRVDHELALGLWDTGNHDARVLAMKVADPARIAPADLDRWARETRMRMCGGYVAMLAAESPHGTTKAREWLASSDPALRGAGWGLVGRLASLDEATPDDWFAKRVEEVEKSIHSAPNAEREEMYMAVISIGGRNAALRKVATAAAKRIGRVEIDHGDTDCKTPEAIPYLEKMWAHATAKKFDSPAAQERAREPM